MPVVEAQRSRLRAIHPLAEELAVDAHRAPPAGRASDVQLASWRNGHLTRRIEHWALAGEAHGIEYRHPLLARPVMEWCLRLPDEAYAREGVRRWVFREAMRDVLPPEIGSLPFKSEPVGIGARLDVLLAAGDVVPDLEPELARLVTRIAAVRRDAVAVLARAWRA
jgi:hypothetical protein